MLCMKTEMIAWAAGIFEGEGSVMVSNKSLRLKVGSTDEDVVETLRDVMGGRMTGPYDRGKNKPNWVWAIYGEEARRAIWQFLPYLGIRRTHQVLECFGKLQAIERERMTERPCRVCGKMFVPPNPRYASRTFYCGPSCKRRVSNGYVVAQLPRTRFTART